MLAATGFVTAAIMKECNDYYPSHTKRDECNTIIQDLKRGDLSATVADYNKCVADKYSLENYKSADLGKNKN